ncbi:MAG: SURF1 family protein [Pseudomonadales bacterium]
MNWKVTTFSVVFLAVFLHLGFWQLERAREKVEILAAQEERAKGPGQALVGISSDPHAVAGLPVELNGRYFSDQVFLLDNRVLDGQVGFEVLVPFKDEASGRIALINRGFVAMGRTRNDLPDIPALVPGHHQARGTVYVSGEKSGTSEMIAEGPAGTTIVQVGDPQLIADQFDSRLYEHLIRLKVDDVNALPRHWPATVMMPATHWGYAIQWFLMALAVTVAWGIFTFHRSHRQEEEDNFDE